MCVSLVVEPDPSRLAEALCLRAIPRATDDLPSRIEDNGQAMILRLGAGGRIVGERMAYNPYLLPWDHLATDPWARSLVGESHGLLVLKSFSEWTSASQLVAHGVANVYEINCAFNRFLPESGRSPSPGPLPRPQPASGGRDRLVLANFKPENHRHLLVPVLFDWRRVRDEYCPREFAMLTAASSPDLAEIGAAHLPLPLSLDAAYEWLHGVDPSADAGTGTEASPAQTVADELDFEDVLTDQAPIDYGVSLFKSA